MGEERAEELLSCEEGEVKQLRPEIPKSGAFKRELRNELLKDWKAHYVDSTIRVITCEGEGGRNRR